MFSLDKTSSMLICSVNSDEQLLRLVIFRPAERGARELDAS